MVASLVGGCSRGGHDYLCYIAPLGERWAVMGLVSPSPTKETIDVSASILAHHAHQQLSTEDTLPAAQAAAERWLLEAKPPGEECGCPDLGAVDTIGPMEAMPVERHAFDVVG